MKPKSKTKTKAATWTEVARRAVGLDVDTALGGPYVQRLYDVTEYCQARGEYRIRKVIGNPVYCSRVHDGGYAPTAEQRLALIAIGPLWEQLERASDAADQWSRTR